MFSFTVFPVYKKQKHLQTEFLNHEKMNLQSSELTEQIRNSITYFIVN